MYQGIQEIRHPSEVSSILLGLFYLTISLGIGLTMASHYFRTQLPTPPSTKKSFLKTIYEGIKNKLNPKPQLEPVTEPAPQYISIDNLIIPISQDH